DDGVDVERADLSGVAHDVERGGVDREVHAEALARAGLEALAEDLAEIVAGEADLNEPDAPLVEQAAVGVVRVDDDEAILVELEMALDQRQGSLADRSEPDHHDRALDATVDRPMRHGVCTPRGTCRTPAARRETGACGRLMRHRARLKPRLPWIVNSAS